MEALAKVDAEEEAKKCITDKYGVVLRTCSKRLFTSSNRITYMQHLIERLSEAAMLTGIS